MEEILIPILVSLLIVFSLYMTISIIVVSDNEKISELEVIRNLIHDLFTGKNFFGVFLSLLFCIILIPSFLLVCATYFVLLICESIKYIWNLGNKK